MPDITNSDLIKELIDGAKLQTGRDKIPVKISNIVIPVLEVNPKLLRRINIIKQASATNVTSATIYTTPLTEDFYLTTISLGLIKDVNATSVQTQITVVIDGATGAPLSIPGITVTAQNTQIFANFVPPLKLDRNSQINITNSTNVGNVNARGAICGYTVYP